MEGFTAKTFKYMTKLEILDLSKSRGIKKEIFSPFLSNLKTLHLQLCNITTLDDDFFGNLIHLQHLSLGHNPITTVPKAISFIQSLQSLDLCYTDISTLDKHSFIFSDKMESLHLCALKNLTIINDCTFCNFPNLKEIGIDFNENLSTIHENAFGSITAGKPYPKLTKFGFFLTNFSTLSERLIDWRKVDEIYLATKGFNCDCSMAWLINDLQRSDSIFSKKLRFTTFKGTKSVCINPPELKGKKLKEASGKICDGKLSTIYHPSNLSPTISSFNFHWIFLGAIIFGAAILCYIYHNQIIKFIYYQNVSQQENDEFKLHQYFNLDEEEDSASISMY
uniref:Uncharacterized protein n=1 Tax=Panagrolaimus superbus TaxID=310955 RepID=A0A914Y425_9BILA